MSLHFTKLRYKNFLSSGNDFTEFDFTKKRTTLVLGANGSGKSTFIDALVFGLYNKAYRRINKPQLVNSINGKGLLVEIEFSTNGKQYLVRRGVKPSIFEIYQDGILINQEAANRDYQSYLEENILKIGYRSFTQIVVLGSAQHVPFMQLSANARREVIEDLLDIQVFSVMNTLLKERVGILKDEFANNTTELKLVEQKIDLTMKHIAELAQSVQERIDEKNEEIALLSARNRVLEGNKLPLQQELRGVQDELNTLLEKTPKEKHTKLSKMLGKLHSQLSMIEKDIEFYEKNKTCPTCEQKLDPTFGAKKAVSLGKDRGELHRKISRAEEMLAEFNVFIERIYELQSNTANIGNSIQANEQEYERNVDAIATIEVSKDALLEGSKDQTKGDELNALEIERTLLTEKKSELLDRKEIIGTAASLLKDGGIKSVIIKQYVPIMNKLIQKYLAAMDFYVQFELDENFNETILSRYRDEFSYASFSEGEKFRIDLALLFTWRAIAKLRNSSTCNLLILDEIFDSSLDVAGTEDFLKIMDEITADTNVFIISHRLDTMIDKFQSVMKFSKEKNFSKMGSV